MRIPMNYKLLVQLGFLAILFLLLMGNRPACDTRTPTMTCTDVNITVGPGECVPLDNPCDDNMWTRVDGFRLCDEPAGIFVQTRRRRSGTERELCASTTVGTLINEPVGFVYVRPGELGEATIFVSTGTALSAVAAATPDTVDPGDPSQLDVVVTGGPPPYSFSWSPSATLSDDNIANPIATPNFTTDYTVTVTDFNGVSTTDTITLSVNSSLVATANPPVINVGERSQLEATVSGGSPPNTYSWVPIPFLDDPDIFNPIASPIVSTTYLVTVVDSAGNVLETTTRVDVNMTVSVSATPSTITPPGTSQLMATVQGGQPPYNYQWTPNDSLDADDVPDPIASPFATQTYTVGVTDSATPTPQSVTDTVTVDVMTGGLDACITPTITTLPPFVFMTHTALCSEVAAGRTIVDYAWWLDWNGVDTDPATSAGACRGLSQCGTFREAGQFDVRLQIEDDEGNIDVQVTTYIHM